MVRVLQFFLIAMVLFQCTQPKYTACEDVLFAKQKAEQFKQRKFVRKSIETDLLEESYLDRMQLDIPLERLVASKNGLDEIDLETYLNSNFDPRIIQKDSVPKSAVDSLQKELVKAQVRLLQLEQNNQIKSYESGSIALPQETSIFKKANTLAKVSFFSLIGGLVFPLIGGLLIIGSIITGFMSINRYNKITNRKGKWMAQVGAYGGITLIALLIFFIMLLFITWGQDF